METERKSYQNAFRHLKSTYKTNGCGTRSATSEIHSFPNGLLAIFGSGNRIRKQHGFPMKTERESCQEAFQHLKSAYKTHGCGTRTATSGIPSFPNGLLCILDSGNRIQKQHEFPMETERESYQNAFRHLRSIYKTQGCRTRSATSKIPSFPNGILAILGSGNRIRKSMDFQ